MNEKQKRSLLILLTLVELGKRVMVSASGNDISTAAGAITVERDGEALIRSAVRNQLAIKGKA